MVAQNEGFAEKYNLPSDDFGLPDLSDRQVLTQEELKAITISDIITDNRLIMMLEYLEQI